MGTPDFAVPCLKAIIDAGHKVNGVFTQPDKRKGRGYELSSPPVKILAQENSIEVYQPATLKSEDTLELLKTLNPDIIVVVAYGKILPESIINLPKYGCINVHGSLLPKYRGAAPIQWSVIDGEKVTGVTTMFMDKGLDTGDMLLKRETLIDENETSGELYERLSKIGAELLIETLEKLEKNELVRQKQNDSESTYAKMLDKSLSPIDFNRTAKEIHNLVRGLNPWPIAKAELDGKNLKIYRTKITNDAEGVPGEIKSVNPVIVCCGEGTALELVEIQFDCKKRMNAVDFFRGYRPKGKLILK